MTAKRKKSRKQFPVDPHKVKRAQRLLAACSEAKAMDKASDFVTSECKRNRLATRAHKRFLRSGIQIKDVYGVLEGVTNP